LRGRNSIIRFHKTKSCGVTVVSGMEAIPLSNSIRPSQGKQLHLMWKKYHSQIARDSATVVWQMCKNYYY
jgi:hypothetical protein